MKSCDAAESLSVDKTWTKQLPGNESAYLLPPDFVTKSSVAVQQWDHMPVSHPYNCMLSAANKISQVDLSQPTWMSHRAEWMKQQFFNREKERQHCSSVTWAFCDSYIEGNTSIVVPSCACLSLFKVAIKLCMAPLSFWQRPGEREENAIIVYQLNQRRGGGFSLALPIVRAGCRKGCDGQF